MKKTKEINPTTAFFIKLGRGGHWEEDCLQRDQTIHLGFDETDHSACVRGNWDKVRNDFLEEGRTKGKATEIANAIRHFYESDENTLWVTFFGNRMWWAFAKPKVTRLKDGSKIRHVLGKSDTTANSDSLRTSPVSSSLYTRLHEVLTLRRISRIQRFCVRLNWRAWLLLPD